MTHGVWSLFKEHFDYYVTKWLLRDIIEAYEHCEVCTNDISIWIYIELVRIKQQTNVICIETFLFLFIVDNVEIKWLSLYTKYANQMII